MHPVRLQELPCGPARCAAARGVAAGHRPRPPQLQCAIAGQHSRTLLLVFLARFCTVTGALQRSLEQLSEVVGDDEDAAVAQLERLLDASGCEAGDSYRAPGDDGNKLA